MKTRFCPVCQHENPENALACAKCGALFTVKINIDSGTVSLSSTLASPTTITESTIFLFIMGEKQPLIFRNQKEITLGRRTPDTTPPAVDLTAYGENRLGVSRKHAVIEYSGDGYLLRDTGSSNGTWLNDLPLIPHRNYRLHSGDKIRLAQLPIIVYFNERKNGDTTFYLQGEHLNSHLVPSDLAKDVIPLLQTISDFQQIIDSLRQGDNKEMGINAIKTEPSGGRISVRVDKGQEAIQLIQESVIPWKKINRDLIQNQPQELKLEPLAQTLLVRIKPDLAVEEAKTYIDRLLPLLRIMLRSTLEVTL